MTGTDLTLNDDLLLLRAADPLDEVDPADDDRLTGGIVDLPRQTMPAPARQQDAPPLAGRGDRCRRGRRRAVVLVAVVPGTANRLGLHRVGAWATYRRDELAERNCDGGGRSTPSPGRGVSAAVAGRPPGGLVGRQRDRHEVGRVERPGASRRPSSSRRWPTAWWSAPSGWSDQCRG